MFAESELDVNLTIKDDKGELSQIESRFTGRSELKKDEKSFVDGRMLSESIGYLKINSWSNRIKLNGRNIADLVEEELDDLTKCDSLIIDVRENSGGDSSLAEELAGHFIDKPVVYCKAVKIKEGSNELENLDFSVKSQGKFLDKKIVILTGPKCLSSNELFIMMLKDTDKAITVGQTTGGGSGNAKSFNLHLGDKDYVLKVSTWRTTRNNGQKLESVGIEPNIPVEIIPNDVIQHRDADLEKAIEYLKQT